jgi:hypothetical protein
MKHIIKTDGDDHTVIMIQTENEIGMLPTARDFSFQANERFRENVPAELIRYPERYKANLAPEFSAIWGKTGVIFTHIMGIHH